MDFWRGAFTSQLDPNSLGSLLPWLHLSPADCFMSGCYQVNNMLNTLSNKWIIYRSFLFITDDFLIRICIVVFQPEGEGGVCYPVCYLPGYGRNTLFFLWNAIVIGLEYAIGGAAMFQLIRAHLPLTVVSLLVASTALPAAHWFTNDYVRSDFFHDTLIGFPTIVRV